MSIRKFDDIYELAEKTHAKVGGFIKYLTQSNPR